MTDRLPWERPLGAVPEPGGRTTFRVWAPRAREVSVEVGGRSVALAPDEGVFEGRADAGPGDDYRYRLDGGDPLPDPCSRAQPEGVGGPSRVVDPAAVAWDEGGWAGLDRRGLVLYELHVGTFTPEGTFAAAAERLPALAELGVTAIELMPVATFPGRRNWGYDGLYAWAPHHAYGGPEGLAGLVAAAHRAGIGVILDVVYNHLGPGAEALEAFGPYHTGRYGTPWGAAMNFDDRDSGGVREWAIQNACMWLSEYRIDGLRVDAVHAIHDEGARHVLAELCARAGATAPRPPLLIAESGLNDPKVIRPPELGGWGFDAQWADDFHHALHALLTGERDGYYADFGERPAPGRRHAPALRLPGAALGLPAPAPRRSRGRPSGAPVRGLLAEPRPGGQPRPGRPAPARRPAPRRAVDHHVALRPHALHGGGVRRGAPFQFFTDHTDPFIADATREGRRREFAEFAGFGEEVPDPQDPATHRRSLLDQATRDGGLRDLYGRLLELRAGLPQETPRRHVAAPTRGWIWMDRGPLRVVGNFVAEPSEVPIRRARRARPGDLARVRWSATAA